MSRSTPIKAIVSKHLVSEEKGNQELAGGVSRRIGEEVDVATLELFRLAVTTHWDESLPPKARFSGHHDGEGDLETYISCISFGAKSDRPVSMYPGEMELTRA